MVTHRRRKPSAPVGEVEDRIIDYLTTYGPATIKRIMLHARVSDRRCRDVVGDLVKAGVIHVTQAKNLRGSVVPVWCMANDERGGAPRTFSFNALDTLTAMQATRRQHILTQQNR